MSKSPYWLEPFLDSIRMLRFNFDECTVEQKMLIRSALARVENPFEIDLLTQNIATVDQSRALNRIVAGRIVKYVELDPAWLGRPRGIWELCALVADDLHIDPKFAPHGVYIIEGYDIDVHEGTINQIVEAA